MPGGLPERCGERDMILKRGPKALGVVLVSGALLVGCGSHRSAPDPVAGVEPAVELPAAKGKIEVHGSPRNPRYDVTFDVTSDGFRGKARIERPEKGWP